MSKPREMAEQIVAVALELGCTYGVDHISSRRISRQGTFTASAINYHFGGIDGLRAKVAEAARQAHARDMRQALTSALDLPPHLRSMPDFAAGLAAAMTTVNRGRTLLQEECGVPYGVPGPGFWQQGAEALADTPAFAAMWALFFTGVLRFATLDPDPAVTPMWVHRAARRLQARLESREDAAVPVRPHQPPPALVQSGREHSVRAREIIDAAVKIILDGGRVSHRAIARVAGVPLGSTTYLFRNRSEIVLEAAKSLYESVMDPKNLVRPLYGTPFDADGLPTPHHVAFRRITLYAARDPALLLLARAMRDSRGYSSTLHLQENGIRKADRLDGLIWSLFNGGAEYLAGLEPAMRRKAVFTRMIDEARQAVFA